MKKGILIICFLVMSYLIISSVFKEEYPLAKNIDSALHKRSPYSYTTTDLFTGEELELWNKHIEKDTPLYGSYNYIKTEFISNGLYQYWVLDNDGNKVKLVLQHSNEILEISEGECMKFLPPAMPEGNYLLTVKAVSVNETITEQSLQTYICGPK